MRILGGKLNSTPEAKQYLQRASNNSIILTPIMADVQYASSAMPTYFPHPPWHPMYSLARDAVEYLLKMRAVDVYTKMKAALAEEMRESGSLYFETASPRAATTTTTSTTIDAAVPSPPCPSIDGTDVVLNDVSSRRWGVDQ